MNFFFESKKILKAFFEKKNIYYLSIVLIVFFFDRYTKLHIINNFSDNRYFINDYMNFNLIWNTGIGFGLFKSESFLIYNFISFLIGFIILILVFIAVTTNDYVEKFIYSVIAGGALGNFYDRLILNAVPDFIDIHYNNFHWFIFNVADIFITLGIICFIIKGFFLNNKNEII
jgi:signal peptidase II